MSTPVKLPARVQAITDHGDEVFSLDLAPMRDVPPYLPGQFLHLALDAYDPSSHWPESRVFSIATSPARNTTLRITFAVKGAFTRRMATTLREGDVVWLKLPYGEFTLQPKPHTETVLIAGGTGITPFVAFLEYLLDTRTDVPVNPAPLAESRRRAMPSRSLDDDSWSSRRSVGSQRGGVKLFYGARNPSLLLYRSLIEECLHTLSDFSVAYFVESDHGVPLGHGFRKGRLSVEAILQGVEHPRHAEFYLSGPPMMIKAFTEQLLAHGITHIRIDAWD